MPIGVLGRNLWVQSGGSSPDVFTRARNASMIMDFPKNPHGLPGGKSGMLLVGGQCLVAFFVMFFSFILKLEKNEVYSNLSNVVQMVKI